jgi:alginate O-acetyltransferase complex protein AlgI
MLAYWLAPSLRIKNYVLLAASLVFYALGEPVYVFLMLIASGTAFLFAFLIDRHRGTRRAKIYLAISATINVAFLFFYKYMPLFIDTAAMIFKLDIIAPHIKLPIGISFYTFQILTYSVDVYRGKTKLQPSFVKFMLYVSMFSQLVAGPIVRYNDIERQLEKRHVSLERFTSGIIRFVCGLAKKVLIADYAGRIADTLLGVGAGASAYAGVEFAQGVASGVREGLGVTGAAVGISTMGAWVGLIYFGFQVYFDFSGYSDMAIGLCRMFGFEILENFRYPFSSKSITDFWRRWHISLGTFFRDYVYIPLGGNRRLQPRNIAVVWLLTGLWHGASWNYVIWGCYFGIILSLEKYISQWISINPPSIIRWAYCFLTVLIGWSLFYYTDVSKMSDTFLAMFRYRAESNINTVKLITDNLAFMAFCLFASMPWAKMIYEKVVFWGEKKYVKVTAVMNFSLTLLYAAVLLFVCSAVRVGSSFSPIFYYRF